MTRPIITFTTDFGIGSPYVAEMKGAALSICPESHLIDISHDVPPQDVRAGALYLAQAAPQFPPGSIHVAVVDPGVGTERRIVVAQVAGRWYVAPDNGLLSLVTRDRKAERLFEAAEPGYWRSEVSRTFHGRDIMAPVAAHLAAGVAAEMLGPPCHDLIELPWPKCVATADRLCGEVVAVDSFGNLITNIHANDLSGRQVSSIRCRSATIGAPVRAYRERPPGETVALIGSSGWLEVAVVEGNAAAMLRAGVGEAVYVL